VYFPDYYPALVFVNIELVDCIVVDTSPVMSVDLFYIHICICVYACQYMHTNTSAPSQQGRHMQRVLALLFFGFVRDRYDLAKT
jgi:hypothetical protein